MTTWADFAADAPALSARVQERFAIGKHKTLATLRKDGSPRISGIEVEFADGEIFLGMMPDSVKLRDLEHDPRLALHSPAADAPDGRPAAWPGEAKVGGRATEIDFPDAPVTGARRFRVDITEVVFTHLNEAGDRLVVESWHPRRGSARLERR